MEISGLYIIFYNLEKYYISKAVELMNGKIGVVSELGSGSNFGVELKIS